MSYRVMGAVGSGGYASMHTICLTDQNGARVKSLYARDPLRYGNIYSLYDVCYRQNVPGLKAPPKPPPVAVNYGSRKLQCTSIYDLYGDRVCFIPASYIPKAPTRSAPQPTPQDEPVFDLDLVADSPTPVITTQVNIPEVPTPVIAPSPQLPAPAPTFPQSSAPAPAPTSTPSYVGPPEDPMQVFDEEEVVYNAAPVEESGMDKKLLIGGILAAVVVAGGVAYVATRKR